jgi:hypothetical protein
MINEKAVEYRYECSRCGYSDDIDGFEGSFTNNGTILCGECWMGGHEWDENVWRMIEAASNCIETLGIESVQQLPEPFKDWAIDNLSDLDIPIEWINTSYHHDVHPSFSNGEGLSVYIAAAEFHKSEVGASANRTQDDYDQGPYQRFHLQHDSWQESDHWLITNSWTEVTRLMSGQWKIGERLNELRQNQESLGGAMRAQMAASDAYREMEELYLRHLDMAEAISREQRI